MAARRRVGAAALALAVLTSGAAQAEPGSESAISQETKVSVEEPLPETAPQLHIERPRTWHTQGTIPAPKVAVLTAPPPEAVVIPAPPLGPVEPVQTVPIALPDRDRDVHATVHHWARAWSEQRAGAYLSFYAGSFRPGAGSSRLAWEDGRRERVEAPEFIEIEISFLGEPEWISPHRTRVEFRQIYRSDRFQDVVRKELILVREGEHWRIDEEKATAWTGELEAALASVGHQGGGQFLGPAP